MSWKKTGVASVVNPRMHQIWEGSRIGEGIDVRFNAWVEANPRVEVVGVVPLPAKDDHVDSHPSILVLFIWPKIPV